MKALKRLAFGALVLMLIVLAGATVIEKTCGTRLVRQWCYDNIAFVALWIVIAVSSLAYIMMRRMWKRPSLLLLHLALVLILVGAGITWFTAIRGKLQVVPEKMVSAITTSDGALHELPFGVTLKAFETITYPGTQAPSDFLSRIEVSEGGDTAIGTISMNKVFSHQGYRFYLSGYDAHGHGVVLTVVHDPWGIAVTYAGYALLLLAMIAILIDRKAGFRRLLRHPVLKSGVTIALLVATMPHATAQPATLPRDVADNLGDVYILHNNRVCPFQTFARQFTAKLCGKTSYKGLTAEQVAAGWLFFYDDWKTEPMIKVKNTMVRQILHINNRWASLDDFYHSISDGSMRVAIDSLRDAGDNATIRALGDADERYQIANMLAAGTSFKIFPLNHNGTLKWYSPGALDIPHDIDDSKWLFMRSGMDYFYEFVARGDWAGANHFLVKLKKYQMKEGAGLLPDSAHFKAEKIYNSLEWDRPLAMLLATLGIIMFTIICRCVAKSHPVPRWASLVMTTVLAISLIYLTTSLTLRWIISGHIPMSNGFETMQFMAWIAMVITLLVQQRWKLALPMGTLTAGMALMVASFGESDPQITQLMPVLSSPLLSIHVAAIMMAYALLAFLMLCSVMALFLRRDHTTTARLHIIGQIILFPAVFLLTAGVFIGAVWANISWGAYWSWDPKETWALITLIIYALPLHGQSLPAFSKPMFFHGYCVAAFLAVIITYFGVNYILGGMHSYA